MAGGVSVAREVARQEKPARVSGAQVGVGWVSSSVPAGFCVNGLGKLDIHRPKGLFARIVKSVIKRNCSRLSLTYAFTR